MNIMVKNYLCVINYFHIGYGFVVRKKQLLTMKGTHTISLHNNYKYSISNRTYAICNS